MPSGVFLRSIYLGVCFVTACRCNINHARGDIYGVSSRWMLPCWYGWCHPSSRCLASFAHSLIRSFGLYVDSWMMSESVTMVYTRHWPVQMTQCQTRLWGFLTLLDVWRCLLYDCQRNVCILYKCWKVVGVAVLDHGTANDIYCREWLSIIILGQWNRVTI